MQGCRGMVGAPFEPVMALWDQREPKLFWLDRLSADIKKRRVRVKRRNSRGLGKKQWDIRDAGGLGWRGARD